MSKKRVLACVVSFEDAKNVGVVLGRLTGQVGADVDLDILVTDNSESSQGSHACQQVAEQFGAQYAKLENLGVSGGYKFAAEIAMEKNYDYLWLWDQDSEPSANILAPLIAAFDSQEQNERVGVVMPKLQDPTGVDQHWIFDCPPYQLSKMATHRYPMEWLLTGVAKTTYFVNSGALVSVAMIRKIGPPSVDFFMDFVDFEYSSRLVLSGYIALVQAGAIVNHRVGAPERFQFLWKSGWARNYLPFRYYYQAKNEMLLVYASPSPLKVLLPAIVRIFLRPIKIVFDKKAVGKKILAHFIGFVHGAIGMKGRTHAKWMVRN